MEPSEPLLWEYGNKFPADLRRGLSCSKIWVSNKSNLVASWMHLHNCRFFQEHPRMLWQSMRALYLAPGGPGSIWNYLGAPVRSTRVSRRFACGFRTDLHFADVEYKCNYLCWIQYIILYSKNLKPNCWIHVTPSSYAWSAVHFKHTWLRLPVFYWRLSQGYLQAP